jgi:hypothetical protein
VPKSALLPLGLSLCALQGFSKFKVGDLVTINPAISRFVPGGVFEVTKQLPGNDERQYRIKNADEPHERVARESDLLKA